MTSAAATPDAELAPPPGVGEAVALAPHARSAALLLAIDPTGLGGAVVRGDGPALDPWLRALRRALPMGAPLLRCAPSADESRLLGGLDVAATLTAGRPVHEAGVMARASGGVLQIPGAERLTTRAAALLASVLDGGVPQAAGSDVRERPAPLVVAADEGTDEDVTVPDALADRLAFRLVLTAPPARTLFDEPGHVDRDAATAAADVTAARARLHLVDVAEELVLALVETADQLAVIGGARAVLLALRAARASAAWSGRTEVSDADLMLAVALVLAPRATRLPVPDDSAVTDDAPPDQPRAEEPPPESEAPEANGAQPPPPDAAAPPSRPPEGPTDASTPPPPDDDAERPIADRLVDAARAALPPRLLAELARRASAAASRSGAGGRGGMTMTIGTRGRPLPSRAGDPRRARLDVLATVRAAAPWQALRARMDGGATVPAPDESGGHRRLRVRRGDFRVRRHERTRVASVIFAVDASGSAALARLAEAKGAIEVMLAESYARRDRVSLVAFRGAGAEVLLPPTRAPARARRLLAGLAGGGGTPLAAGLDTARALAGRERRGGADPLIVVLTDGRANIGRDGTPGRPQARTDALVAARAIRADNLPAVIVDVALRPEPFARAIADAAGARYLWLPGGDGGSIGAAVRQARPRAADA